jgi:hypothetical protein
MSDDVQPKRGLRFLRARQITRTGEPMPCTVTRVTRYAVYFRNETGFLSYVTRDRFANTVLSIIDAV